MKIMRSRWMPLICLIMQDINYITTILKKYGNYSNIDLPIILSNIILIINIIILCFWFKYITSEDMYIPYKFSSKKHFVTISLAILIILICTIINSLIHNNILLCITMVLIVISNIIAFVILRNTEYAEKIVWDENK